MLSAEDLLAGAKLTFDVEVPRDLLPPADDTDVERKVRLRPLTVQDLQLISRAAKDDDSLVAALAVKAALVEPRLELGEIRSMPVGLLEFLLRKVNTLSGIEVSPDDLSAVADEPLAKAAFVLAREFGWTPEQVNNLTLGQVLLHLKMLAENRSEDG